MLLGSYDKQVGDVSREVTTSATNRMQSESTGGRARL